MKTGDTVKHREGRMEKPKKLVTGKWPRFGIQNHIGGIWTPETFETKERAQKYLDDQRASWPGGGLSLRKHKVVKVRVTVTAIHNAV